MLMLFNSADRLGYSEIKSQLGMTDDEVTRLLHSLSRARYKILNKEPNSQRISRMDYFEFNSEFTEAMKRIKVTHGFTCCCCLFACLPPHAVLTEVERFIFSL